MVQTRLGNYKELLENITYEVLPVTTLSGLTFWFAFEIRHTPVPTITTIGIGCLNQEDACEILESAIEN